MTEDNSNIYDELWTPQEYLRQYYSQDSIPDDEEAVYQRLIPYLKREGRKFARAIDFGCGPTVHLLSPLAPWVEEIHLADYLPGNLREVQKWLQAEEGAHNWDINIRRALEIEGGIPPSQAEVETRKNLLRRKVTALKQCDLRQSHPLGDGGVYDLLLSAYCVDAATDSTDEWRRLIGNLLTLCADGGTIVLLSARKSQYYKLGDNEFPNAEVDEEDIAAVLAAAGFAPPRTAIEVVPIKSWADAGINSVVITIARR